MRWKVSTAILALLTLVLWARLQDSEKWGQSVLTAYHTAETAWGVREKGLLDNLETKDNSIYIKNRNLTFVTGLAGQMEDLFKETSDLLRKYDKLVTDECMVFSYSPFKYAYVYLQNQWTEIDQKYTDLGVVIQEWIRKQQEPPLDKI